MIRITITIATGLIYLLLILSFSLPDLIKYYFPGLLDSNGHWPEYLRLLYNFSLDYSWLYYLLVVFYIGYSGLSNVVPRQKRYLWCWLIFFAHFITIPYFWYYYIWGGKQSNNALKETANNAAP